MSSTDDTMQNELKERWDDLTGWMTDDVKNSWWERIVKAFSETHRHYHTLAHLYQMFQHYDMNKDALTDRYSCAYAIFFHDIVYNPKAKDNESQSAEVFHQFSSETTLDSASYITRLIEATTTHCTEAHMTEGTYGNEDVHFLLDFDMAILGADPEDYETYSKQIRQEYNHVDEKTYAQERLKVLQLFLQIPNIFATAVFRDNYEAKARKNIQTEIDRLKAVAK